MKDNDKSMKPDSYIMNRKKVAEIVFMTRKQKGFSLRDLAKKTGLSASYLSRLERSERKINLESLVKICEALEIDFQEFINPVQQPEEKSIEEILVNSDITYKDKKMESEQKLLLIEIINEIIESNWSNDSVVKDIGKIMELIDEFKRVSK